MGWFSKTVGKFLGGAKKATAKKTTPKPSGKAAIRQAVKRIPGYSAQAAALSPAARPVGSGAGAASAAAMATARHSAASLRSGAAAPSAAAPSAAEPSAAAPDVATEERQKEIEDLKKAFDDAFSFKKDNRARELLKNLSNEEINALPESFRTRMKTALEGGVQTDADDKYLNKLTSAERGEPTVERDDLEGSAATTFHEVKDLSSDPNAEKVVGKFSAEDVHQGVSGDCWFLAALASLAEQDPAAIDDMIEEKDDGTYNVTLYVRDEETGKLTPKRTNVTAAFPVNEDGERIYAHSESERDGSGGKKELWPAIIEKGAAQIYSDGDPTTAGYENLSYDNPTTAFELLTGRSYTSDRVTKSHLPKAATDHLTATFSDSLAESKGSGQGFVKRLSSAAKATGEQVGVLKEAITQKGLVVSEAGIRKDIKNGPVVAVTDEHAVSLLEIRDNPDTGEAEVLLRDQNGYELKTTEPTWVPLVQFQEEFNRYWAPEDAAPPKTAEAASS